MRNISTNNQCVRYGAKAQVSIEWIVLYYCPFLEKGEISDKSCWSWLRQSETQRDDGHIRQGEQNRSSKGRRAETRDAQIV